MSYTNSTSNLHLPQYIATDKPTYLGDWNASMQTLDTAITSTQATANGASSTAASANATAQTAQNTANNALNKANTNETNIQQINNNFETENVTFTNPNNGELQYFANSNNYNFYMSLNYVFTDNGNITSSVVNGNDTNIPLASTPGNIFGLTTSSISTPNYPNIITLPGMIFNFTNNQQTNLTHPVVFRICYDGANTIIYITILTSVLTTMYESTPIRIASTFSLPRDVAI